MPEETCLVGYADDVTALVAARSIDLQTSYAECQQFDDGARTYVGFGQN